MNNAGDFSMAIYNKDKNLMHKSEHAYVIRKKSGKRQIAKDNNAGSNIKSTGSELRRQNEQHLIEKITKLIKNNDELISKSNIILL